METKTLEDHGIETEEFPVDFQCCVCLDLLYKPVALACGHISCFWCVFKAMDACQESHCPVCRHPYYHFPSICQLLHFVLLKLYPVAYKRRERQVIEEEKEVGYSSPQFDNHLSGSHASEELNILGTSLHSSTGPETCSTGEQVPSPLLNSSEIIVPDKDTTIFPAKFSGIVEATGNLTNQDNSLLGNDLQHGACKTQTKSYPETCSTREQVPFPLLNSSEIIVPDKDTTNFPAKFSGIVEATGNLTNQENSLLGNDLQHGACKIQTKLYPETCSTREQVPSPLMNSLEIIVPDKDTTIFPAKFSGIVEATGNLANQENSLLGNDLQHGACKQVSVADLLCAACKNLLFQPVVLNCGHVYCKSCIINLVDGIPRCQLCQSMHPCGFPKVCLVLQHFLEEQFSETYAQRREAVLKKADCQYGSPSTCSTQAQQNAAQSSSKPTNDSSLWWSRYGPNVHIGVGCDFCGMCPIIGERYKCKDCVEKIGFDLCEACYNTPSKLPGRFNQQHTAEHKFEIVPAEHKFQIVLPNIVRNVFFMLDAEEAEEDASDAPEDQGDVSPDATL